MADQDLVTKWQGLSTEQRQYVLTRMTPEQKSRLTGLLKTKSAASPAQSPSPVAAVPEQGWTGRLRGWAQRTFPYTPPGTEPAGESTVDRVIGSALRPIANVDAAAARYVGGLPAAIAESSPLQSLRQGAQEVFHPLDAMQRRGQQKAADNAQYDHPYDPSTRTGTLAPGQVPSVDYDQDVPEVLGPVAVQVLGAEAGGEALKAGEGIVGAARGEVTPGGLRRAAQKVTGVSGEKVGGAVTKVVNKAGEDHAGMVENNAHLEEQRTRRRQIQDVVNQKTKNLNEKSAQIEARARAENKQKWDTVRSKTQGAKADIGPLQETVKAAAAQSDPTTSPLFRSIINEQASGPRTVTGTFAGAPFEFGPEHSHYAELYEAQYGEPPPLEGESEGGASFDRLQRWYSYVNSRMYGGRWLEPGTYNALKAVRGALDSAMGDIASKTEATEDLAAARGSHRQMMETFHDSPNESATVASKALQEANPGAYSAAREADRVEKVSRYDPSYGTDHAELRGHVGTLESFPSEDVLKNKLQEPADMPQVSLQDVRKDLLKNATARWTEISQYKVRRLAASGIGGLVGFAAKGVGGLFEGGSAGYMMSEFAPNVAASIVNRPAVVEWLTKPTLEDLHTIEQIPGVDRIRITDAMTTIAADSARSGRPVRLAPQVQRLLGARNLAIIANAGQHGTPAALKQGAQQLALPQQAGQ